MQAGAPSTKARTSAPTFARPAMRGAASLVTLPSTGSAIVGACGAVVRTRKRRGGEDAETLPARSVAVAVATWSPSARGWLGQDQKPAALAVTVQVALPFTWTSTWLPATAWPESIGAFSAK